MIIKQIVDEDFVNYKKPSMLIMFPKCTFKCGEEVCHNREAAFLPDIEISIDDIIWRYVKNPLTDAIICGGLEPFDSYSDLLTLVRRLREKTSHPIIIYTGYTEEEISHHRELYDVKNIIIKYGRFIPHHQPHYDTVLGIHLSSDNQYAKRIS